MGIDSLNYAMQYLNNEKKIMFHLQLKPLNWFTLGHKQTDSNNQLIIKSKWAFMYEHYVCKSSLGLVDLN